MEGARAAGTTLGSGVVLVLDDSVDLIDQLRRIAAFFRDESCGQCVPCRVGTVRQEEVLVRLATQSACGRPRAVPRPRQGDPRRQHLRARPDRAERHRVRHRPSRGVPVSTTEGLSIRRKVELEIDGETVSVLEGATILQACREIGTRDPHPLLRRDDHAEERVSRLHGRGRRVAGARSVVLTQGGGRDGRAHRQRARPPQPPPGARTARLVRRPLAHPQRRAVERRIRRRPRSFRSGR